MPYLYISVPRGFDNADFRRLHGYLERQSVNHRNSYMKSDMVCLIRIAQEAVTLRVFERGKISFRDMFAIGQPYPTYPVYIAVHDRYKGQFLLS